MSRESKVCLTNEPRLHGPMFDMLAGVFDMLAGVLPT